jgi:hypothetical protein
MAVGIFQTPAQWSPFSFASQSNHREEFGDFWKHSEHSDDILNTTNLSVSVLRYKITAFFLFAKCKKDLVYMYNEHVMLDISLPRHM